MYPRIGELRPCCPPNFRPTTYLCMKPPVIKSILVANRSEIAIRVMRAASEMHIRTVGVLQGENIT